MTLSRGAVGLQKLARTLGTGWPAEVREVIPGVNGLRPELAWPPVVAWILLASFGEAQDSAWFDRLEVRTALAEVFASLGFEGDTGWQAAARVRLMLRGGNDLRTETFWADGDARWLAGVSTAGGTTWVNKERFEDLVCRLALPGLVAVVDGSPETLRQQEAGVAAVCGSMTAAGYDLGAWLAGGAPKEPAAPEAAGGPIEVMAGGAGKARPGKRAAEKAAAGKTAPAKAAVKLAAKPKGAAEAKIEKDHGHGGARKALVAKEAIAIAGQAGSGNGKSKAVGKKAAAKKAAAVSRRGVATKTAVKAVAAPKTPAKKTAVKLTAKPKSGAEAKVESPGRHKGARAALVKKEAARPAGE